MALVHIKCSFEHQLRRMHFALGLSFDEFVRMMEHEYSTPLVFEYETANGSLEPLDSADAFAAMLREYEAARAAPASGSPPPIKLALRRRTTAPVRSMRALMIARLTSASLQTPAALPPTSAPSALNVRRLRIDLEMVDAQAASRASAGDPLSFMRNLHSELSMQDIETVGTVGHGAGGIVTAVIHRSHNKLMALKRIPLEISNVAQKQILTELEVLHQNQSDAIVGYHGSFFAPGAICICTEFMDCGSLDSVAQAAGPLPEAILARVADAVLRGLSYLYAKFRVLHRDIKPSNILLNSKGEFKLCDFGVSGKLVNSLATTYVGTNAYMAPERIQGGGEYNIRSDVWSLGIALVELATGASAFGAHNISGLIDLLQVIVNLPSPSLPENFSPQFRDFVDRCLIKDPAMRPAPDELTDHPFISHALAQPMDVAAWAQKFRLERFLPYADLL